MIDSAYNGCDWTDWHSSIGNLLLGQLQLLECHLLVQEITIKLMLYGLWANIDTGPSIVARVCHWEGQSKGESLTRPALF